MRGEWRPSWPKPLQPVKLGGPVTTAHEVSAADSSTQEALPGTGVFGVFCGGFVGAPGGVITGGVVLMDGTGGYDGTG